MKIKHLAVALVAAVVALAGWSCDKEPAKTPVQRPSIGIMEPEFDAETMNVSVMIAPSTDAEAWYWMVKGGLDTDDAMMTKEQKNAVLAKARSARSEQQMHDIVQAIANNAIM